MAVVVGGDPKTVPLEIPRDGEPDADARAGDQRYPVPSRHAPSLSATGYWLQATVGAMFVGTETGLR
jgi:hypothetical protein